MLLQHLTNTYLLHAILQLKIRRSSSCFPLGHLSCGCMGPDLSDKL